jgi:hypothetical protein
VEQGFRQTVVIALTKFVTVFIVICTGYMQPCRYIYLVLRLEDVSTWNDDIMELMREWDVSEEGSENHQRQKLGARNPETEKASTKTFL